MSEPGFTLVELLLVVVILGVVASLAVPNFRRSFVQMQLQNAVQDLAQLMRYGQSRAVDKAITVRLTFGEDDRSYRLLDSPAAASAPEGPEDREYQKIPGPWGRAFVLAGEIAVEPSRPHFDFFPDGRIDKGDIELCHEERCLVVSSRFLRGQVEVLEAEPAGEE